jgi:hypothetical protein
VNSHYGARCPPAQSPGLIIRVIGQHDLRFLSD